MRRVLSSWPYVVVVVAGYAAFWGLLLAWAACDGGGCVLDSIEFKSLAVTYLYAVVPVLTFATGAVLGFRRGYDWVTVLVCLAVWLVIPEPITGGDGLGLFWGNKLWFPLIAIAVIGHLGILAGIGISRLTARRRDAEPPARTAA